MSAWFGSVNASGFVFDEALTSRAEVLERVVAMWADGARLGRHERKWYLVGLAPRRVDSRVCPGTPLTFDHGRWLGAPFSADRAAGAPMDSVIELVGGQVQVHAFGALTPVHPVDLMELEVPRVLEARTLEPPLAVVIKREAVPGSVDAVFSTMLASLNANAPPVVLENSLAPLVPPTVRPLTMTQRLRAWLATQARARANPTRNDRSWLSRLFGGDANQARENDAANATRPPRDDAPRSRSWLSRLFGGDTNQARENDAANATRPPRDDAPRSRSWLSRLFGGDTNQARENDAANATRALRDDATPPRRDAPRSRSWLSRLFGGDANHPRENDATNATRSLRDDAPRSRSWLSRLFSGDANQPRENDAANATRPPRSDAPRSRSWLGRLFGGDENTNELAANTARRSAAWDALADWLTPEPGTAPPPRVTPRTGPGSTEAEQRAYLDDLRKRFVEGDLAEALRRAISLGGSASTTATSAVHLPRRRDSLPLLGPSGTAGAPLVLPTTEFDHMRSVYRDAADRLIAEGRIDEAAYLLARLLNDAPAGVALLEKHGRFELAAQLATAQHLPDFERIRLWLLADRIDEAIALARGSRDFSSLVTTLNTRAPELARRLRGAWGEYLAQHQRYTEAIVATAPLPEPPPEFATWVEHAVDAGGTHAATALAVNLARNPSSIGPFREQLERLLEHDADSSLATAATAALVKHAPNAPGPLYRDLWRRLMRGASQQHRAVERTVATDALRLANDPALAADAVAPPALAAVETRGPLQLAAPILTGTPVLDVAELPKHRRVIAEGAAGLRVLSRSGQTIRHHLVKADALVVGPPGVAPLVISLDGHLTRVWKLDPRTLELTHWFQARIDAFARRFDGLCWAVGLEGALVFLDPASPSPMEWWRVPGMECRSIDHIGSQNILTNAKSTVSNESWQFIFDVGAQRLERRLPLTEEAFAHQGQLKIWSIQPSSTGTTVVSIDNRFSSSLRPGRRITLATTEGIVVATLLGDECRITRIDWKQGTQHHLAELSRVRQPVLRELSSGLVVCDEYGRVTQV